MVLLALALVCNFCLLRMFVNWSNKVQAFKNHLLGHFIRFILLKYPHAFVARYFLLISQLTTISLALAVRILSVGSRSPALQNEALVIFDASVAHQVRIEPEWIPREENQQADLISRIIDHDDWSVHPDIFQRLERMWGPHTVDRFASFFNTQLPRFNSRFWNPGSEAVDAFTCDWHGENNWWCPPVYLVPRVLRHAQATRVTGTLLVPKWPSATFCPTYVIY